MPDELDQLEMKDHYYDAYCEAFGITDGQIDYDSDRWNAFILGLKLASK
jgi:hypothetical protein